MLRFLMLMVCLGAVSIARCDEELETPTDLSPTIMQAKSVERDSKQYVSLTMPVMDSKPRQFEVEIDGKKQAYTRVTHHFVKWYKTEILVDGSAVKSFEVDGKEIAASEVHERLKNGARVAVLLYHPDSGLNFDRFYLDALKEKTVVLRIPVEMFYAELNK